MLAQLVSVALTASVKTTDTESVSSFNHFLSINLIILKDLVDFIVQHLIASILIIVSFPSLNLLAFFVIGKFGQHYHI